MATKNTNKPSANSTGQAKVAASATPNVDPTTLPTQQIYSGEQERRDALAEVTALRREFDTTTAAGARAFANSAEAQAALARLDAAKSDVGMRTSAQDLQALNTVTGQGQTQALNAPSTQYFQNLYSRPDQVPTWEPPRKITTEDISKAAQSGYDYSKARYDWVWSQNPKTGQDQWVLGVIGALTQVPNRPENLDNRNFQPYADNLWRSGTITLKDFNDLYRQYGNTTLGQTILPQKSGQKAQQLDFDELTEALPEINYSQYQEILYQLALERDTDITVEDMLDKYDELYGEG
jgi:hypothetical protein